MLENYVPLSGGSSSNTSAIIGGAVGGVILLLLMIPVVLCIVMLCMRRRTYHKFLAKLHDDRNSTIIKGNNRSYDNTKPMDYLFKPGDSDIPITTNPSYDVIAKPYSKASEDEYNYVETNKCDDYLELEGTIKIDTNPSYGVTTGDRTTTFNISDTKAQQSSHDATTKEYDYACVHDDHLLHHNTAASSAKKDNAQASDEGHYMENIHPLCPSNNAQTSNKGEYDDVNHPKSDASDYGVTQQIDNTYI